jgi:hypothetical protein
MRSSLTDMIQKNSSQSDINKAVSEKPMRSGMQDNREFNVGSRENLLQDPKQ